MRSVKVWCDMALELGHQEWGALSTLRKCQSNHLRVIRQNDTHPSLVSNRVLDFYFLQLGAIVQFDGDGIADGPLFGIVILGAETLVFDTADLGTEFVNARIGSGRIGTT